MKKILVVGGNFGDEDFRRSSKIVTLLAKELEDYSTVLEINGGPVEELPDHTSGLTVWMPNISNDLTKQYPRKAVGSTLIVSKVVRHEEGQHKYTEAVARIFKMGGNAVIAVEKMEDHCMFTLIDALGNIWVSTRDLTMLADGISKFEAWNSDQQRRSVKPNVELECFMKVVRDNAHNVMNKSGDRYFGNCSTRCAKTFPSIRATESTYLFSPRNSNKESLEVEDMVLVFDGKHVGPNKPSVDAPVQSEIYKHLPRINFMIHGHAFIEGAIETDHYYACGDMREVPEVLKSVESDVTFFAINLTGHGYIVGANTSEELEEYLAENVPVMKPFRWIGTTNAK